MSHTDEDYAATAADLLQYDLDTFTPAEVRASLKDFDEKTVGTRAALLKKLKHWVEFYTPDPEESEEEYPGWTWDDETNDWVQVDETPEVEEPEDEPEAAVEPEGKRLGSGR